MKTFQTLVGVKKPVAQIAAMVRDRLPEIAPHLSDVTSIAVTHRSVDGDGRLHLTNAWHVDPALPGAVRQMIGEDALGWHDHAVWSADLTECYWRIETFFMPGAIQCAGSTRFEPAMGGRGTKAVFSGEFDIDPAAFARIPVAWRGAATSALETIVGSLIPRNFRKTIGAAEGLLTKVVCARQGADA